MSDRKPNICKHSSGQARVTIAGRVIYLGKWGTGKLPSREAQAEYDRVIAEWRATGQPRGPAEAELTVGELVLKYWRHAEEHYRKDGDPTSEQDRLRSALRDAVELYGTTAAARFGPLALKAVRERMIQAGRCRNTVNKYVQLVKRAFRWATEEELIPPSVYHGLAAVAGLRRGRSQAPETKAKRPVPETLLQAVRAIAPKHIVAMIDLQLLTGMRPGELCILRGCDLDTTGRVWLYRPERHKTEHHDQTREVYIGPRAQDVLKPFLKLDTQAYLFNPAAAELLRQADRRQQRRTPLYPSHARRLEQKRKPRRGRPPGNRYTVPSYRHAIERLCDKAFPLPEHLAGEAPEQRTVIAAWRKQHRWQPNQLRHNAGTNVRKEFGAELAQLILGHRNLKTTEIYAEADRNQAMEVIARIG
ncbi:MAG: site-specific integrase [Gemmataceae bacterium]|nr:site-specific integrase [Gemmataceae bacterium]